MAYTWTKYNEFQFNWRKHTVFSMDVIWTDFNWIEFNSMNCIELSTTYLTWNDVN